MYSGISSWLPSSAPQRSLPKPLVLSWFFPTVIMRYSQWYFPSHGINFLPYIASTSRSSLAVCSNSPGFNSNLFPSPFRAEPTLILFYLVSQLNK